MAAKLADTGGVYGVDGRLERGGSHDSGKFDWWMYIFWVDRWIFGDKKVKNRKKKVDINKQELARARVMTDGDKNLD